MAELREDSLLFSLETLMARERERVALERAESERQQALATAARIRAEKQRLEAELARERELEQGRLAEQQRLAEHAARLDALRQSELERARREAEARAQSELLAQRHAHERRMTELQLQSSRARDRALAAASTALLALLVPGALWFYFGYARPHAEQLQSELGKLASVERTRADEGLRALRESERERARLAGELGRLQSSTAAPAAAPLTPTRPTPSPTAPALGKLRDPAKPSPARKQHCKDSADPLNPCLP
ncbi:MAG TPA: hypothetical protein VG937_13060 [Polyangiaceae bacterium]|jgi:colicin import membrane protein|nr:hypothetical protein [Polyangiaceae bacterium]